MTELEMIYLYKQNNSPIIRDVLYEKYKLILHKITTKWMQQNFKEQFSLDKNDFMAISYLSFLKTLKVFDNYQTKYSFLQALVVINHANMNHYCRTFWNLRNKIMNNMIRKDIDCGEGSYDQMLDTIDLEIKLDKIKQTLLSMGKNYLSILELKLQGFSQREIAKKIGLTKNQVHCLANGIKERLRHSAKINFVI